MQFWSSLLKDPEIISAVSNTIWYGKVTVFKRNVILDSLETLSFGKRYLLLKSFCSYLKYRLNSINKGCFQNSNHLWNSCWQFSNERMLALEDD